MKKLVVLLAMALCLCLAAPVMAGSDTWMGGVLYGGGSLYGTGDLFLSSNLTGDGGSNTSTGGTQVYVDANLFGSLSADDGAGNNWGQTYTYIGAYEGTGYTGTYVYSGANANVQTVGNASGSMNVGSWADGWAWNY